MDAFRLFLELIFAIALLVNIGIESYELCSLCEPCATTAKDRWKWFLYFNSIWNYFDVINLVVQLVTVVIWVDYNFRYNHLFSPHLSYNIYQPVALPDNPDMVGNWFKSNETTLTKLVNDVETVDALTKSMDTYFALHGFSYVLMLFRSLKVMGFQQRLALVTDTLFQAAPDLFHFFVVSIVVVLAYAFMAYVYLGHHAEIFSTYTDSVISCLMIFLGEVDALAYVDQDDYAGQLWFWSYIVISCLILLNILLAILVDSYAVIKEKMMEESTPLPSELYNILNGVHGGPLSFDYRNRKKIEKLIATQHRWVLLREKFQSGNLTASKLQKLLAANTHTKDTLRDKMHKLNRVTAVQVPCKNPVNGEEEGEGIGEDLPPITHYLSKVTLMEVLKKGRVDLDDIENILRKKVASLVKNQASMFPKHRRDFVRGLREFLPKNEQTVKETGGGGGRRRVGGWMTSGTGAADTKKDTAATADVESNDNEDIRKANRDLEAKTILKYYSELVKPNK